jgi:predicted nucleotidyltransferase
MGVKKKEDIQFKPPPQTRLRVRRLAPFGSYAQGYQQPRSDVDALMDVDPSIGHNAATLTGRIEQLPGLPVNLISSRAVKAACLRKIKTERIHV